MNCNYKVKISDVQTKYKFKIFCTGYDDSELKQKIDTMYEAWPKASGEGETVTLDNTANATMSIDLKGNTSQETTTGKNKYNATRSSATTSAVTYSGDTSKIYINGTPNGEGRIFFNKTYLEAGTYTFSMTLSSGSFTNGGNNQTYLYLYKGTEQSASWTYDARVLLTATKDNVVSNTFTIAEGGYYYLAWYLDTHYTWTNAEMKYQVETGNSFTSFEPYTNGASPNPDYPQDVHVVSGDNTIKVEGKNLFKDKYILAPSNENKNAILKAGTYTIATCDNNTFGTNIYFKLFDSNGNIITTGGHLTSTGTQINFSTTSYSYYGGSGAGKVTFTIDNDYQLNIGLLNSTGTRQVMLVKGTTEDRNYISYQSQSYAVNLGTMELCKIGTYQDYIYKDNKKWYKYGAVGKAVFDGTENWIKSGNSGDYFFCGALAGGNIPFQAKMGTASDSKFNYFVKGNKSSNAEVFDMYNGTDYYTTIALYLSTSKATDVASFKTWLTTHNTILYYVPLTATTTEITDATLISQLEALAGAESYSGQTNISQTNDDKPFILTAKALKDLSNL